ncbi:hypothetical protein BGX26_006031 [Mortierella sp. AD094]|nr:hypothetical protein BGX26_006031 [Mortierella sp. AD094]
MFVDSIVGFASLALTIAGFINPSQVPNAKVRLHIQAGKDGTEGLGEAGSHIPTISLLDTSNRFLGEFSANSQLKLGSDQYWNYDVSTAIPSELKTLNIRTDYCHSWYSPGKYYAEKELRCGWLDGDNSNGNSVYGMALNTDILGSGYIESYVQRNPNPGDICSSGSSPFKWSFKDTYGKKAYVTSRGGAIEICDSPTSWGPSMLSLEQWIFCDMITKTKVPICGHGKEEGCVEYNRGQNKLSRPQRTMTANNVSCRDISYDSYDLKYFVISDINGTILDDGSNV